MYQRGLADADGEPMYVVIFRAKVRQVDEEYLQMARKLRDLALQEFGCYEFHAVTEGKEEIALSYWPDENAIRRWKKQADHLLAQQRGRDEWYESYSVQIAEVVRSYGVRP